MRNVVIIDPHFTLQSFKQRSCSWIDGQSSNADRFALIGRLNQPDRARLGEFKYRSAITRIDAKEFAIADRNAVILDRHSYSGRGYRKVCASSAAVRYQHFDRFRKRKTEAVVCNPSGTFRDNTIGMRQLRHATAKPLY